VMVVSGQVSVFKLSGKTGLHCSWLGYIESDRVDLVIWQPYILLLIQLEQMFVLLVLYHT
jgi:hypothetical protein